MQKKGFPQSYNTNSLINFIMQIKSGIRSITVPIYSHLTYDIIQNFKQTIKSPSILILEGLNILQRYYNPKHYARHIVISDFIDFSIYIDAPEYLLQKWYIHRFLNFYNATHTNKKSYFSQYSQLSKNKIASIASSTWNQINAFNLNKNILPTKEHAHLILTKDINHKINSIFLKKSKNII